MVDPHRKLCLFLRYAELRELPAQYHKLLGGEMVQVVELLTLIADALVPLVQTRFHELANQLDFSTNCSCIIRATLENTVF